MRERKNRKKGWIVVRALAGVALAAGIFCFLGLHRQEAALQKIVRVGIAVYNGQDAYIGKISGYLEQEIYQYEKNHPDVAIRSETADAGGNQWEQNKQIERFISLEYDLLLVNIVDRTNAAVIIDKASSAGIPMVFFNREPVREDLLRGEEIYYEGSDARQSALLQADIIAETFQKNPGILDRDGDGVLSFAMLEGETGHQDAIIRSEWVLKGLEERGVKTRKVVSGIANWERGQANTLVKQWVDSYGDDIEVIISNNDDMAIGAAEALEEKQRTEIQVVGIDGVEEVAQLVQEGKVLGTVLCDTKLHAKALLEFIEALAIDESKRENLGLEDERYYMIPLSPMMRDEH